MPPKSFKSLFSTSLCLALPRTAAAELKRARVALTVAETKCNMNTIRNEHKNKYHLSHMSDNDDAKQYKTM